MSTLTVELGARSYPIHISANNLSDNSPLHAELQRLNLHSKRIFVITNPTVSGLWIEALSRALLDLQFTVIEIPDGEQYKTLSTMEQVIGDLLKHEAARDSVIIALGGGVVGDLAGFVAASYQRGIPFIQIPTTLLSQVDSSVGGKTAVNHALGKNMIGAFYQPQAVIIDTETLATLPAREFAAGMAEVVKYGIIYDAAFFQWLEDNVEAIRALQTDVLQKMIYRCCEIKAEIVAQDEKEKGLRALLNLGHTFGHAIEAEQGFGNWLHGEAVAAGTIIASKVAKSKDWMTASEFSRIEALHAAFDLPLTAPDSMHYAHFMQHMKHDKKVESGQIRFIIPQGIGKAVVTSDVTDDLLKDILN